MTADVPINVLLVDDLEENLVVLESVLRREGVALLKAHSGDEALELLGANEVAVAFIDVQMPGMDGIELAERMRESPRTSRVPIIFVTAGTHDRDRMCRGYDAGAVDFLYKPFESAALRQKADTFLELYRRRRALEEALRLNEELIAIVGHDLRNPLHAILMLADVIASTASDRVAKDSVASIKSSGLRMSRMIDALVDLSHMRLSGGIPIVRRHMDLGSVASRIAAEHQAQRPSRAFEIRCSGDLRGEWDGDRIEQALSNLVADALGRGERDGTISIHAHGAEEEVLVSVHKCGHIPPESISQLFEPFRAGGKNGTRGAALGVYMAQQIARSHGGSVEIESAETSGTTFRLRLPRRAGDGAAARRNGLSS